MGKVELAQENWKSFFEEFNSSYKGKIAYVEVTDNEGYHVDHSESISFSKIGMNKIDEDHITISVNAGKSNEFEQYVDRVERIVFDDESEDEKYFAILQIYSSLGSGASIKFYKIKK